MNRMLLQGRLNQLTQFLAEIEPLLQKETREITHDHVTLYATERLFQLIVDSAISINNHIIAQKRFVPAEDYQGTFTTLAENKVIPTEFALRIGPSVGLRNQLIHKYGDVNISSMVDKVKNEIGDYAEYLTIMQEFVKQQGK